MNPDPLPTRPIPLPAQARPARKRMITVLRAANLCLGMMSEEGVKKAIEALAKLDDTDLAHAIPWLGGTGPVTVGISLEAVDKLLELIASIGRVRPRLQAAVAAAKVRGALKGLAEQGQQEPKPEDVAKLKAQVEN